MGFRHNEARGRYELDTPNGMALAVHQQQGDRLVFTHTEVPPADEGKGVGSRLVRAALDDARARDFRILPACSFVVAFVQRHPEYSDG